VPAVGAVTVTPIVQVPLAAMLPPEKVSEAAPAAGEKVGAPQPEVVAAGVPATTMAPGEVGSVSVKLRLLSGVDVGFVIVNVSVETPPSAMGLGLKLFAKVSAVAGSTMEAIRAPVE
jgi:hypothetical protein